MIDGARIVNALSPCRRITILSNTKMSSLTPTHSGACLSSMERLLILGCKRTMDEICVGCSRCLVAFNRREGEFARYEQGEADLIGLASCGDCPGTTMVQRLTLMKLVNAPLNEEPTKIHLAPCLAKCPHSESIVDRVKTKCGIEIIYGTHPYIMDRIFD